MSRYFKSMAITLLLAWSHSSQALPLIELTVPLELTDLPQVVKSISVQCDLDNPSKQWTARSSASLLVDSSTGRPEKDRVVVRFNQLGSIPFMPTTWRCSFAFRDAANNFLDMNNDSRFQPVANTPFVRFVSGSFQPAPASP